MSTGHCRFSSVKTGRALFLVCVALTLAACSGSGLLRKQEPGSGARTPGGTSVESGRQAQSRQRGRRGTITLAGTCKQTESDGYAEDARVNVINGKVTALDWNILIPRRGTCHFEGARFRQTKSSPSIKMEARDGSGCNLMMWSDPRRVTLAHSGCAKFCTQGAYAKAWPVMFHPQTGRCADIRR